MFEGIKGDVLYHANNSCFSRLYTETRSLGSQISSIVIDTHSVAKEVKDLESLKRIAEEHLDSAETRLKQLLTTAIKVAVSLATPYFVTLFFGAAVIAGCVGICIAAPWTPFVLFAAFASVPVAAIVYRDVMACLDSFESELAPPKYLDGIPASEWMAPEKGELVLVDSQEGGSLSDEDIFGESFPKDGSEDIFM